LGLNNERPSGGESNSKTPNYTTRLKMTTPPACGRDDAVTTDCGAPGGRARVKKDFVDSVPSVVTLFYHNPEWQVLAEYNGAGALQRYYVYGNYIDEPLVMRRQSDSEDYYYAHDHLYSVVVLLDDSGNVVERYEYDAYGTVHIMDSSFVNRQSSMYNNPYTFTGRRMDVLDAGNLTRMHYRHRDYDPRMGRFLQQDPIEYEVGMNLYQYVSSMTVTRVDPLGLAEIVSFGRPPSDGEGWMPKPPRVPGAPGGGLLPPGFEPPKLPPGNGGKGSIVIDPPEIRCNNPCRHYKCGQYASRSSLRRQVRRTGGTRICLDPCWAKVARFAGHTIATLPFDYYVSKMESMGKEKLKKMGWCKFLRTAEAELEAETGCRVQRYPTNFQVKSGGKTYHVAVVKKNNACYFTVATTKYVWKFWPPPPHKELVRDETLPISEECPADMRSPSCGCK